MTKQWQSPIVPPISDELREATRIGIDPFGDDLIARTLAQRGILTAQEARAFLYPDQYIPASPYDLPDMHIGIERIHQALTNNEKILIWGDFDVDGQTASALWVSALSALGGKVAHFIPNRAQGHGIHVPMLEKIINGEWKNGFIPQLVITCDTGITAHEAVQFLNSCHIPNIITDHHQLGETLPPAYAVINPQRLDESHPKRTLPGVGVVFECVRALYERFGKDEASLIPFLDLVALGIVADVAVQRGDTRYWLQRGLNILRQTSRLGLKVMYELAEVQPDRLNEETISFQIAPRLNSLGRLDDAGYAVDFLIADDLERSRILANRLEALNLERRFLSDEIFEGALAQTRQNSLLLDSPILVLGHEKWHGGVIGVVANRLVEHFGKPVILFTFANGIARGSARSISGLDITACIAECAPLLLGYGGHTMAGGLSLLLDNLPDFRREIARAVRSRLSPTASTDAPILNIDAYIPLSAITFDFLANIDRLRPFGAGNPSLTFATERVTMKSYRQIGKTQDHLKITVEDEAGLLQDVMWWRARPDDLPTGKFDLAYIIKTTTYKEEKQITVEWVDARLIESESDEKPHYSGKNVTFTDYRNLSEGEAIAELIQIGKNALIWNEGDGIVGVTSKRRHELYPAQKLVIWSSPPSPTVLADVLHRVNPSEIVLFAVNPRADSMNGFISHLGSVVKEAISEQKSRVLDVIAGELAHTTEAILAGLDWLAVRGHITIENIVDGVVTVREGGIKTPDQHNPTTAKLAHVLQETAAYRGLYKTLESTKFPH